MQRRTTGLLGHHIRHLMRAIGWAAFLAGSSACATAPKAPPPLAPQSSTPNVTTPPALEPSGPSSDLPELSGEGAIKGQPSVATEAMPVSQTSPATPTSPPLGGKHPGTRPLARQDYVGSAATPPPPTSPPPAGGATALVTAPALNVRRGPGMAHPPTRTLQRGTKVAILERINKVWVRIGPDEFVSQLFLELEN